MLTRGRGPDFSERDRALLALLRPHLHQAYLDAERRRDAPQLTRWHWDLLRLIAAGQTNAQIARRLSLSRGTVRKHTVACLARRVAEPGEIAAREVIAGCGCWPVVKVIGEAGMVKGLSGCSG